MNKKAIEFLKTFTYNYNPTPGNGVRSRLLSSLDREESIKELKKDLMTKRKKDFAAVIPMMTSNGFVYDKDYGMKDVENNLKVNWNIEKFIDEKILLVKFIRYDKYTALYGTEVEKNKSLFMDYRDKICHWSTYHPWRGSYYRIIENINKYKKNFQKENVKIESDINRKERERGSMICIPYTMTAKDLFTIINEKKFTIKKGDLIGRYQPMSMTYDHIGNVIDEVEIKIDPNLDAGWVIDIFDNDEHIKKIITRTNIL